MKPGKKEHIRVLFLGNHRLAEVGRDLQGHQITNSYLSKTMTQQLLSIFKDRDATTSLSNQTQLSQSLQSIHHLGSPLLDILQYVPVSLGLESPEVASPSLNHLPQPAGNPPRTPLAFAVGLCSIWCPPKPPAEPLPSTHWCWGLLDLAHPFIEPHECPGPSG